MSQPGRTFARARALFLLFPILGMPSRADAATRKAVVIGINVYNPTEAQKTQLARTPIAHTYRRKEVPSGWAAISYKNLSGAVADAETMKGILTAMGFTEIVPLYNQDATADRILSTLDRLLIAEAKPGDIRFVYYSGHGGFADNKATQSQDETLVPADHWRDVPDIRDKELSRILYAAGKKGVIVTMVADSCHSGSLSRGAWDDIGQPKGPDGGFTPIEVNDPPDLDAQGKPIDPKDQGVMLVSASQRNEEALEYWTEEGPHGAFTWALRRALAQGPNQRAGLVLQRTLSYLEAEHRPQIPVMDANADRAKKSLWGDAVDRVEGLVVTTDSGGPTIRLRGGPAIGIYPGCELIRLSQTKPAVRIRVTKTLSAASSEAVVVPPAIAEVAAADQFQVDKYVVPESAMLRVYFPRPAPAQVIAAFAAEIRKLSPSIHVLEDATQGRPTHVISWAGNGWILETHPAKGRAIPLAADAKAGDIRRSVPDGSVLLVVLPPSPVLASNLRLGKSENTSIQVEESVRGADYLLQGRIAADGGVEYAWVLPDSTEESVRAQTGGEGKGSELIALPLRSDWTAGTDAGRAAALLTDQALRLGRVRAWLSLPTPPDAKAALFPYHLALENVATDAVITSGDLKGGARFKVALMASDSDLKKLNYTVTPRFVYVFAVDHFGKGTLIFPALGHGNEGNHVPAGPNPQNQNEPVNVASRVKDGRQIMTLSPPEVAYDFDVGEPYGVDTYFLLTSEQPVDDPGVFEFDGARSKGGTRGTPSGNPLTQLLSNVGAGTRGANANRPVPTGWAIERFSLRSLP
jgi:Caspase domain